MNLKHVNKEEIRGRARMFFRSDNWKNTLVFFSFVILASSFWALQFFRQKIEFEIPIWIQYAHVPTGIVLSGNPPQQITLHVQDKGSAYLSYFIKRRKQSLSIIIDLKTISLSKTSYVIDQMVLRDLISEKLSVETQIKSFSPDKIEINYSPLAQKELPVTINGTISPASGYLFSDSIRIEPDRVIIYGEKNVLDTLLEIQTLPLNHSNIDKNRTISAVLQIPEGIRLSVNQAELSVKVEEYTERTFELPVICYNTPSNRKVHFFPSTVELSVRVGLSKYSLLSKSSFEIAVNYNDLAWKNTANCSLTLTQKPPWIESYRIAPNMIEFLIEQKSD
jgi:hypothetical protein